MKIVIVSFFDTNNIGDLMITKMMHEKMKRYSNEITLISYLNGNEVTSKDDIIIDKYVEKDGIDWTNILKRGPRFILNHTSLYKLWYRRNNNTKQFYSTEYEKAIRDADLLVIGGGNMVFDIYKHSLSAARYLYYVDYAKELNKNIFTMSLGIGPFKTEYQLKLIQEALSKSNYITFRDKKSFELYNTNNEKVVENWVTPDPVFLLPKIVDSSSTNNVIGINIMNNPLYRNNKKSNFKVIQGYVELIEKLIIETDKPIKLFSTETIDYEVIDDVFNKIDRKFQKNIEIVHINSFEKLIKLYDELEILIGTRMHSMIIAFTQHIPIIGLAWQPKVREMFKIIGDQDSYFELLELVDNIDSIINLLQIKTNKKNHSKVIAKRLIDIKERESKNDDILKELIKE